MDHIYGVIENFLDGQIILGKKFSHTTCINPPHVIVFSNDEPKKINEMDHKTTTKPWGTTEPKIFNEKGPQNPKWGPLEYDQPRWAPKVIETEWRRRRPHLTTTTETQNNQS